VAQRHRWLIGALGIAAAVGLAIFLVPRSIEQDAILETAPEPARPSAETAVLSGPAALAAAHDSIAETLAEIRTDKAAGNPVMAVKVLGHVDIWRQHIGASGQPTEKLAELLQHLAVVEQRSSMGYPDGSLTPNDLAIITDKLIILEAGTAAPVQP
jgi:hypothetical protein